MLLPTSINITSNYKLITIQYTSFAEQRALQHLHFESSSNVSTNQPTNNNKKDNNEVVVSTLHSQNCDTETILISEQIQRNDSASFKWGEGAT